MNIAFILNKNNNNLDLIRIFLACLVIVGHSPILNGGSDFWIDPIGEFFSFTYSGALAVKIFFFVSGLLVTSSWLNNRSTLYFVVSRFFRLMPALLFVLLITVFVFGPIVTTLPWKEYFSNLDNFRYIWKNLIFSTDYSLPGLFAENPYKNAVNGSLWSLNTEVACYIVLLGTCLLLGNKNKYYLNIPIAIIIIDSFLPSRIFLNFLGDNPELNLLPASFALGALYAVNADKLVMNFKIVLGFFLLYYAFSNAAFAQLIFVFASCNLALYLASTKFVIKLKPKKDISYGIYLWGFLVQQTIVHYTGNIYVGLHCLLAIVMSILLALLTNILVEKPFINLGKSTINSIRKRFPVSV